MALNSVTGNLTLAKFINAWPVSSLRTMKIEQYADLIDHNAFCYWLEYGSRDLGEIGGMPLTKFGLWKFKERKDFDKSFESDSVYAWNGRFGKARMQAYNVIIRTVAEIAEASAAGDWQKIEDLQFHAISKWKMAFLYSNKRLVPIYTREALLRVAAGLGRNFPEKAPIVDLQQFIMSEKPGETDTIDYALSMWGHYVDGKPFRNYFIIGSTVNDKDTGASRSIFPEMLASKSIAIGFLPGHDLSPLLNASDDEIDNFIEDYGKNEGVKVQLLQSYFRILLRLKPGDIIAVKSDNSVGTFTVVAYAVVVEKNGKVYEYKPGGLGHHVNVDFVELGINRKTNFNYAGVLYHISSDKADHLKQIFGPFLHVDNIALGDDDDILHIEVTQKYKPEESYQRGEIASRMVRQLHNIIQNSFFTELKRKFPRQTITMEFHNRVDIVRENGNERWFYEIKPFENVVTCLRYAAGQLLEYAYRFQDFKGQTNLVIVGPGELIGEAKGFLDHFAESIKLPISYEQHIMPLRQNS